MDGAVPVSNQLEPLQYHLAVRMTKNLNDVKCIEYFAKNSCGLGRKQRVI